MISRFIIIPTINNYGSKINGNYKQQCKRTKISRNTGNVCMLWKSLFSKFKNQIYTKHKCDEKYKAYVSPNIYAIRAHLAQTSN